MNEETKSLKEKVKAFLDIQTDFYDTKLTMLINGAISKLTSEGVNEIPLSSIHHDSYAICVSCQVGKELDIVTDHEKLDKLYYQRLIPLKEMAKEIQNEEIS